MKRLAAVAALCAVTACTHRVAATDPTDFYGELALYGDWVALAPYGRVWRPSPVVVGNDFYPYFTNGHWEPSDEGWSWHSEWAWGWIPFHHGRWVQSPEQGWVWVPGDAWAPAWVEWRVGGGLVGWVPLGPQGVSTAFPGYQPRWCFVPLSQFGRTDFHRSRLEPHREYAAYHAATAIPFRRGAPGRGPSVELVRRAGGDIGRHAQAARPRTLRRGDVAAEQRVGPATMPPMPPPPPAAPPVVVKPKPGERPKPGTIPPPAPRRAGKRPPPSR